MKIIRSICMLMLILILTTGCSLIPFQKVIPADPPIKLLVTQITMNAPLTSPSDIHTFHETPPSDDEAAVLAQLIEEVEARARRLFTEQLAQQKGFNVIPFDKTNQMRADLYSTFKRLDKRQRSDLGTQAGADIVLSGRILDFGEVQWRYWVTGLILSMAAETLAVGAVTGFNPAIMGITAASELITDLPFWWGGAYIAGWAFRPVRVKIKATQITGCEQHVWKEEELKILIPGKSLEKYPPEDRKRKEVQLGVNLEEALAEIAKTAGRELRLKPCDDKNTDI